MHNPKAFCGSFNHPIVNNTGIANKNFLTICNCCKNPGHDGIPAFGKFYTISWEPHREDFFWFLSTIRGGFGTPDSEEMRSGKAGEA
jgi:hypothetical protein